MSSSTSKWKVSLKHWLNTATSTYKIVKGLQAFCVIYMFVVTFSPEPVGLVKSNGYIDPPPRAAVKAANTWQMVCLAFSRSAAYSLLPPLALIFLTKCKATLAMLANTPISFFISVLNAHELHVYVGQYIAFYSWVHAICHVFRWADQGELYDFLFHHRTGISGVIAVLVTPLITFPMMFYKYIINPFAKVKKALAYETRKVMHNLFAAFGIALCFHVHPYDGFIAWFVGIPLMICLLDMTYIWFYMTERVVTSKFTVLPNGMQMTMRVSDKFSRMTENGGYVYVCLPWVSKYQWHAFSLYEDPIDKRLRHVFMQKNGDWTSDVHKELQRDTRRPVWVQGPFPSPYTAATHFDNQICIASGIGITAAISVINAHKHTRRVSLIWILRDLALLEFYLKHHELGHDGFNLIFYTGKDPLPERLAEIFNVTIVQTRPDLFKVIPRLIQCIEASLVTKRPSIDIIREVAAVAIEVSPNTDVASELPDQSELLEIQIEDLSIESDEAKPSDGERKSGRKQAMGTKSFVEMLAKGGGDVDAAEIFVSQMSAEALKSWGIMYCGGAKAVEEALLKIAEKYDIDTHIESFAW